VLEAYVSRLPVTILFTTGPDAFQRLVARSTKSVATHAALGLGDQLLHAYEEGVILEPRDRWFGEMKQKLIAEFEILPDVSDGVANAMQHVGKKYDGIHIVKAGFLRLFHPTFASLGKTWRKDRFTCAQFVTTIDPYGEKIPEWRHLWRAALAPSDLLEAALWGPSFARVA
jgi:hypothetical protein